MLRGCFWTKIAAVPTYGPPKAHIVRRWGLMSATRPKWTHIVRPYGPIHVRILCADGPVLPHPKGPDLRFGPDRPIPHLKYITDEAAVVDNPVAQTCEKLRFVVVFELLWKPNQFMSQRSQNENKKYINHAWAHGRNNGRTHGVTHSGNFFKCVFDKYVLEKCRKYVKS